MHDVIITGASRGIGAALASALASGGPHQLLVARTLADLHATVRGVEERGGSATAVVGDLGSLDGARRLGRELASLVEPGATLVHNAGIWPTESNLGPDGFETAYVVNFLAPLAMQAALLERTTVGRILVVSAGLLIKGRFDARRTPTGDDFSAFRTYCTTKLCFAVAMREFARAHPDIDVLIAHPGVVRTSLGARGGLSGWLLRLVKRRWESPEDCAERLAELMARERWSPPGEPKWWVTDKEEPWPGVMENEASVAAIRDAARAVLGDFPGVGASRA